MKKFFLYKIIFVLTISVVTFFSMIGNAQSVKAAQDWGDQFISHVELQNEAGIPQTSFGAYDNMQVHWSFIIPPGKSVKPGDTMTVKVPEMLSLKADVEFDVKDEAASVIGHVFADHNSGLLKITFADYIKEADKNGVTGDFKLWVHWDISKISQKTKVSIDWGTFGKTEIKINPGNNQPDKNEELLNWGVVDPKDPTLIHWSVRVNFALTDIKNALYKDNVGPNQQLVSDSFQVYSVASFNKDGSAVVDKVLPPSIISQTDDTHFIVNLRELKKCVYITYDTRATDKGASSKYLNSGTLSGSNIETHTVSIYTPENGGNGDGKTTVSIFGTKIWVDDKDAAKKRPKSITIDLYQNDLKIESQKVTDSGHWAYSFTNLQKYDKNKQIYKYFVKEEPVDNYIPTQDGNNFINTITGQVSIKGKKVWRDDNDLAKQRPKSITINLLADGKKIKWKTVTKQDDWSYNFGILPQYQNGKVINYSITEESVANYAVTVDGYNVINTYKKVTPVVPKPTPSTSSKTQSSNYKRNDKINTLPKTGDNASLSIFVMFIGSLILNLGIYLIILKTKRKN